MIKYAEILFRHRLRFLILLLVLPLELSVSAAVLYPHNTAVSSLWVATPTYFNVAASATGWSQYLTPAQNTVDALDQMVKTGAFVRRLARDLDANGTFKDDGERAAVLGTVGADLHITVTGSHLVTLVYTAARGSVCIRVLAATLTIYEAWFTTEQQAQAKVAIDFYTTQILAQQEKLQIAQSDLSKYTAAHPQLKPQDAPLVPEFDQLVRNVDQERAAVVRLQDKLEGIQLTDAAVAQIDRTILNVIDPPKVVATDRLSSLPRKQIAIAWIACLALAAGALVLMTWLDRNARDPKELATRLGIRVVATIPDLASAGSASG